MWDSRSAAEAQLVELFNGELGLTAALRAAYRARLEKAALAVPGVLGVHDLRAEYT